MKLASADYLGFSDLAEAWASDPGSRSYDYILAQLLSAYWQGAFETLLDTTPDVWPQRLVTYRALKGCAGLPPEGLPIEDDGEPNWNGLSGVSINNYPIPGQAVMNAVELPRDMIRLWCLDQGYELPRHWFPTDKDGNVVGRPSIAHRLISQMTLRGERKELEPTVAAEARALYKWAETNLGHDHHIPKTRSIENAIREPYRGLKNPRQAD